MKTKLEIQKGKYFHKDCRVWGRGRMTPMNEFSFHLVESEKGTFEPGLEGWVGVFQEKICPSPRNPGTSLLLCHLLYCFCHFPETFVSGSASCYSSFPDWAGLGTWSTLLTSRWECLEVRSLHSPFTWGLWFFIPPLFLPSLSEEWVLSSSKAILPPPRLLIKFSFLKHQNRLLSSSCSSVSKQVPVSYKLKTNQTF